MTTKAAQGTTQLSEPASDQDVLDAPPHKVAEVIAGTLHMNPRPVSTHARASTGLGAKITTPYDHGDGGPGGWWIVFEPELHLGEDILVPDLAGWRRERMPDWVCEVLSPSTRALDQGKKRAIDAREGVAHLWFVGPDARTLEAFELMEGQWVLLETLTGNDSVSLPPFGATSFSLGALWSDS